MPLWSIVWLADSNLKNTIMEWLRKGARIDRYHITYFHVPHLISTLENYFDFSNNEKTHREENNTTSAEIEWKLYGIFSLSKKFCVKEISLRFFLFFLVFFISFSFFLYFLISFLVYFSILSGTNRRRISPWNIISELYLIHCIECSTLNACCAQKILHLIQFSAWLFLSH